MEKLNKGIQEIIDSLPFYVLLIDSSHHIQMANKAVKSVLKVEPEHIIGGYCPKVIHGIDSAFSGCPLEEAVEKGHSVEKELYDSNYKRWLLSAVYQTSFITDDGKTIYIHTTRDITDRKQAEYEVKRVNKVLLTLSECNQALIRATDESKLLHDICRIIVEDGGYRLAWVGFAEKDENKTVRVVAQAGYEDKYLENINITWADTESGHGPTGTAIRTGEPVLARNVLTDPQFKPWRDEAIKRGYAS